MEEKNGILKMVLRYSKRIAIFGVIQWICIALIIAVYMGIAMNVPEAIIDENVASILKSLISSSSSLAIAISLAYFGHSLGDDIINKHNGNIVFPNVDNQSNSDGNG